MRDAELSKELQKKPQYEIRSKTEELPENMQEETLRQKELTEQPQLLQGINSFPVLTELKKPDETMVLEAHRCVGLSLTANSLRHPRRVKRALAKYEMQHSLREKQKREVKREEDFPEIELLKMQNLDLAALMYDGEKKGADEKLLSHYSSLKECFAWIAPMEEALRREKEKEGQTDYEKESLFRQEAHLKTLRDIRDYYGAEEELMNNPYYALLPREEMRSLSVPVLRSRLARLLKENPENRNQELIGFYRSLVRIGELGLKDAESLKKLEEQHLLEVRKRVEDKRNPGEELQKIAEGYLALEEKLFDKRKFLSTDDRVFRRDQYFRIFAKDIEGFRGAEKSEETKELLAAYDDYVRRSKIQRKRYVPDQIVDRLVESEKDPDAPLLEKRTEAAPGIRLTPDQLEGIRLIQGFLLRRSAKSKRGRESLLYHLIQSPPEQQLTAFYLLETGREEGAKAADFYTALSTYVPNLEKFRKMTNLRFYNWGGTKWDKVSLAIQAARGMSEEMSLYGRLEEAAAKTEKGLSEEQKEPGERARLLMEALSCHTAMLRLLSGAAGLREDEPYDLAESSAVRERLKEEHGKAREAAFALSELMKAHPELKELIETRAKEKEEAREKDPEDTGEKKTFRAEDLEKAIDALHGNRRGNYTLAHDSISELLTVQGISSALYGFFSTENDENIETMDLITKWTEKTGTVLGGLNAGASGIMTGLGFLGVVGEKSKAAVKAGSAFGGVTLGVSFANAAKSVAGMGRSVSKGKDILRAKQRLDKRSTGKTASRDEKMLRLLLSHEQRDASRRNATAAVTMVTDFMGTTANIMALSGVLTPVAGMAKTAATVVSFLHGQVVDSRKKKQNIKKTVDEFLGLEKIKAAILRHSRLYETKKLTDEELSDLARQEILGHMGFASYKDCFRQICSHFAEMIHVKLFRGAAKDREEWEIYHDALKGLGMKSVPYRRDYGDDPHPNVREILAKILS